MEMSFGENFRIHWSINAFILCPKTCFYTTRRLHKNTTTQHTGAHLLEFLFAAVKHAKKTVKIGYDLYSLLTGMNRK